MPDRTNELDGEVKQVPSIEALRERAAGALEAALGFVELHGNELARLRARIAVGLDPLDRGLSLLSSYQSEDGSFRDSRGGLRQVLPGPLEDALRSWNGGEGVCETLEAFSVLSDWQRLYEPSCDRAVEFLRRTQCADGGWGAGTSTLADHPMRIFATGCLAGFLGRTRTARPEVLRAAGGYLRELWSVDSLRNRGWPAVAAFAHYFTNVHDDAGEAALPWCSREIERGRATGEYRAVEVLRILFYCEASALPGADFCSDSLLADLMDEQLADGSVRPAEGPAEGRVASTLDAMMFMLRLCRGQGEGR